MNSCLACSAFRPVKVQTQIQEDSSDPPGDLPEQGRKEAVILILEEEGCIVGKQQTHPFGAAFCRS